MMLGVEEILCELERDDMKEQGGLPPGFRFHPTDEELVSFYLASKVFNGDFCGLKIAEVDLNRCEPWELPDAAKMGDREWYFFSLRDRKYPTGLRTNRATGAGYWKATGKDREVYGSSIVGGSLLGMKKTLVFYRGRAPRGEKTKWVMHEYRLDGEFSCRHTGKEEWVICRIFHKIQDKKTPPPLIQDLLIKSSPFTTHTLPPLLETPLPAPPAHQDPPPTPQTLTTPPLFSQSTIFPPPNFYPHQIQDMGGLKELSHAIAARHCKQEQQVIYEPHFPIFGSTDPNPDQNPNLNPFPSAGVTSAVVLGADTHAGVMDEMMTMMMMPLEPAFRSWEKLSDDPYRGRRF